MRYIGLLHSGTRDSFLGPVAVLTTALPDDVLIKDNGRYANDDRGDLEDLAEELVKDGMNGTLALIIAAGGPEPALVLQNVTQRSKSNLPIIFTTVADPVASGLVQSLKAPGYNLTGMAGQTSELDPVRAQRLFEFTPNMNAGDKLGILIKESRDRVDSQYAAVATAAKGLGLDPKPKKASTPDGIRRAFEFFQNQGVGGVVVMADSFFNNHRGEVVEHAAATGLPTIYQWKEFVDAGGLISHGPSLLEAYKKAGDFATDILDHRGDPATMPCSMPSSYKTYINPHTAKALGINVLPPQLSGQPVYVI